MRFKVTLFDQKKELITNCTNKTNYTNVFILFVQFVPVRVIRDKKNVTLIMNHTQSTVSSTEEYVLSKRVIGRLVL
jgi:hypothetical protein